MIFHESGGGKYVCANCDYELIGLADCGQCPECGAFFDLKTGKGIGCECQKKAQNHDRLVRRLKIFLPASVGVVSLVVGGLLSMFYRGSGMPIYISGAIALVFFSFTIKSLLSEKTPK